MKVLASRIIEGLKRADHFAVYEADLSHFWPESAVNREAKINAFARENGLRLRFYKPGLCAIFDKDGDIIQNGAKQAVDFGSPEPVT